MIPSLHLITSDQIIASGDFGRRARLAMAAGGEGVVLHLRTRSIPVLTVLDLADELLVVCTDAGGRLSVSDRLDVATAVGCGWGHVGGESVPAAAARDLMGHEAVLGASVHSAAEAEVTAPACDYLIAGNVFKTASHPDRSARGLGLLESIRARSPVGLVAIGGVTPERVGSVVKAGADGVAVLSGVWSAGDPGEAVTRYLQALGEAGRPTQLPSGRNVSPMSPRKNEHSGPPKWKGP